MPRPIHFEVHADQPERAIAFYTALLGWEFTKWGGSMPYWLIKTGSGGPGIDGGMVPRRGSVTPNAPVIAWMCTVDVDNVDAYVAKALSLGGEVALPKMPIPGVGWLAYVKDTEGNIFGMMQNDPKAA